MIETAEVGIIGLGAMGSAAASALTRRGVPVVAWEQNPLGTFRGSSGGRTRLTRQAYFEHPDYVPLLRRAHELWADLERRSGRTFFHRCGCLYLGPRSGELVSGVDRSASRYDVPVEALSVAELRERWPALDPSDALDTRFEPGAGFLECEAAVRFWCEEAAAGGADLRSSVRVLRFGSDPKGAVVESDTGESWRVRHLICAAGPWTGRFVDLGQRVTRQTVAWFEPPDGLRFDESRLPCWAIEDGEDEGVGLHYGFPVPTSERGVAPWIKAGHHRTGAGIDPDRVDRAFLDEDAVAIRRGLEAAFGAVTMKPRDAHVCMYTMSLDGHFALGACPGESNVTLAAGFSGHGFKFAPLFGEVLADLATQRATSAPIALLDPKRFC